MKTKSAKHKALFAGGLLTVVFTCAAHLEWVGYKYFDRPDGSNILCSIDPACRPLAPGERLLAKTYFGSHINPTNVKIFNRPFMGLFGHSSNAISTNGNIYIGNENLRANDLANTRYIDPKEMFVHEMTHVAQHQRGVNIPFTAAKEWIRHLFNYDAVYLYDASAAPRFKTLNIEQQARMMEHYFRLRSNPEPSAEAPAEHLSHEHTSIYGNPDPHYYKEQLVRQCKKLKDYETRIGESIPIAPHPSCRAHGTI